MLTYIMRRLVTVHNELSKKNISKLLQTSDNRVNNVICDGYPNINVNERRTKNENDGFSNNHNNTSENYTQMALPCKLVLIVQTWSDVGNQFRIKHLFLCQIFKGITGVESSIISKLSI